MRRQEMKGKNYEILTREIKRMIAYPPQQLLNYLSPCPPSPASCGLQLPYIAVGY
jgi:hypothetical protein